MTRFFRDLKVFNLLFADKENGFTDTNLMGIFSGWNVRDETMFSTIEVYENEGGEYKNADDSVATESCF